MLKYVVEEVDRVKGLFEKKEQRLIEERDDARKEAAARIAAARSEAASAAARATDLEARLGTYPQQLEVHVLAIHICNSQLLWNTCFQLPTQKCDLNAFQEMACILLDTISSFTL